MHDRNPVWSPDGTQLAWLSDAGGEYELMIGDPAGIAKPRAISLPSTAYFSDPEWSPDGKQMLLQDNHRNLWLMEISSGKIAKLDTDAFPDPTRAVRGRMGARFEMDRLREKSAQPPARDFRLLA